MKKVVLGQGRIHPSLGRPWLQLLEPFPGIPGKAHFDGKNLQFTKFARKIVESISGRLVNSDTI